MRTMVRAALTALSCASALLFSPVLQAHPLTPGECSEASDFIRNAALARDEGMREKEFIAQFHADVQALQRLPAELRWFVQDKEDEAFLLSAVTDVFRHPKPAERHQAQFALACASRIGNEGGGIRI